MTCQPNGVCTGSSLYLPFSILATACANGGTIMLGVNQPRSPPLAAELSLDLALASSANLPPFLSSAMTSLALSSESTRMWLALYSLPFIAATAVSYSFLMASSLGAFSLSIRRTTVLASRLRWIISNCCLICGSSSSFCLLACCTSSSSMTSWSTSDLLASGESTLALPRNCWAYCSKAALEIALPLTTATGSGMVNAACGAAGAAGAALTVVGVAAGAASAFLSSADSATLDSSRPEDSASNGRVNLCGLFISLFPGVGLFPEEDYSTGVAYFVVNANLAPPEKSRF